MLVVVDDSYECDDDNMGCSVGTLLESGIAPNGENAERREWDSADIQVRLGDGEGEVVGTTRNG